MAAEVDKKLAKSLQVAKKKPRNFAIIAKGANPLKLLVSKKPIADGVLQKAKKECQGNAVLKGVVQGDGGGLVFRVTEQPSPTEVKLRALIIDSTGANIKARWEVVEGELPEINDDTPDDEVEAKSPVETAPEPLTTSPPDAPESKLLAVLQKMGPSIKQAAAIKPDRQPELIAMFKQARQLIEDKDAVAAKTSLLKLGELVKQIVAVGGGTATPPSDQLSEEPASDPGTVSQDGRREPLLPIWLEAKEQADQGIGRLQDTLRQVDDEDLNTIVDYGLYGATTGQSVKLMAALRDADHEGSPEALANVLRAVDAFRDFLAGAPIVDLIEENEFGVNVPLRQTLGAALDQLERLATA